MRTQVKIVISDYLLLSNQYNKVVLVKRDFFSSNILKTLAGKL